MCSFKGSKHTSLLTLAGPEQCPRNPGNRGGRREQFNIKDGQDRRPRIYGLLVLGKWVETCLSALVAPSRYERDGVTIVVWR